jgi:serine/threonine protein kinase
MFGVVSDLTEALAYMHSLNIAHGDIYAHNVLVHKDKSLLYLDERTPRYAILFDFGASFFYPSMETSSSSPSATSTATHFIESAEVRAFGLLLKDMLTYLSFKDDYASEAEWFNHKSFLDDMASACTDERATDLRPNFALLSSAMKQLAGHGPAAARHTLSFYIKKSS